jgi:hypothetical protein
MLCKCKLDCCSSLFLSFLLSNTGLQQNATREVTGEIRQDRRLIEQQTLLLQQIANLLERQQELEQRLRAISLQNSNTDRRDAKKDIPQQTRYYRSQTQTVSPSSEKNEVVRKMSFVAHDASLKAQERNSRLLEEQKRREEEKKEDLVEKEEESEKQEQKKQRNLQEEKT